MASLSVTVTQTVAEVENRFQKLKTFLLYKLQKEEVELPNSLVQTTKSETRDLNSAERIATKTPKSIGLISILRGCDNINAEYCKYPVTEININNLKIEVMIET